MMSNKTPEQDYVSRTTKEHRAEFSQFFTPPNIAKKMQKWILEDYKPSQHGFDVLDPAVGPGVLVRNLPEDIHVYGFEKDLTVETIGLQKTAMIRYHDYLTSRVYKDRYDAVIANPPYLKGGMFDTDYAKIIKRDFGVELSPKANLYCYFLVRAISECRGRYAFLVPSDFLDSNYGVGVKKFLLESNSVVKIEVYEKNIFPGVFTKSCIIYGDRDTPRDTIQFCNETGVVNKIKNPGPKEKWNRYYEPQNVVEASHTFGEFANVTRGVNTGDNTYFVLNKSQLLKKPADFKENTKFCLLKPAFFNESIITDDDIDELFNSDLPCMMFSPKNPDYTPDQKDAVSMYIKAGKKKGVDKNFTCASRKEWWKVEHREIPTIVCGAVTTKLQFIYCEGNIIPLSGFNCIYPKRHTKEYGRFLHAYLMSSVAVKMFAGNKRNYGGKIKVMTAKDMMEAPCVDLWRLFKDRNKRKHVMAAYNLFYTADRRILLEERIADYRRLVDDVFREFV